MPDARPDVVTVRLSTGKQAQHLPDGRLHCHVCSETSREPVPAAKAPNWLIAHQCYPNRHYFDLGTNIADTDGWVTGKGYAWEYATWNVDDGLRLTRAGHPDVIAPIGSVLLWDGEQITVEQV